MCRTGPGLDAWNLGAVVELLVRDQWSPQGMFSPYRVRLDDGRVVVVRSDCDSVIRGAYEQCSEDDGTDGDDMDEDGDEGGDSEIEDEGRYDQHQGKRHRI